MVEQSQVQAKVEKFLSVLQKSDPMRYQAISGNKDTMKKIEAIAARQEKPEALGWWGRQFAALKGAIFQGAISGGLIGLGHYGFKHAFGTASSLTSEQARAVNSTLTQHGVQLGDGAKEALTNIPAENQNQAILDSSINTGIIVAGVSTAAGMVLGNAGAQAAKAREEERIIWEIMNNSNSTVANVQESGEDYHPDMILPPSGGLPSGLRGKQARVNG